jgi:hypothetical protein
VGRCPARILQDLFPEFENPLWILFGGRIPAQSLAQSLEQEIIVPEVFSQIQAVSREKEQVLCLLGRLEFALAASRVISGLLF